jgi:hypothetical protein
MPYMYNLYMYLVKYKNIFVIKNLILINFRNIYIIYKEIVLLIINDMLILKI